MRIAFYAPMKPPDHPVPSGDRRMGQLLTRALARGGHQVDLASGFRSYEGTGDPARQAALRRSGIAEARRLIAYYKAQAPAARPDLWFTYHVYYKAPDWIGPEVARALKIPYAIAEASHAGKRDVPAWRLGHRGAMLAIGAADLIFSMTAVDRAGIAPLLGARQQHCDLPPFLDVEGFAPPSAQAVDKARPTRLLTVAMMREGAKLESYRRLAAALARLADLDWHLTIIGDGPAREEVAAAFAEFPAGRVRFTGALPLEQVARCYREADLYLWPAAEEAYGMALLEAQASGLPVIAARVRGVPDVVQDGQCGFLTPDGDIAAFADTARFLICDSAARAQMGLAARAYVRDNHGLDRAAMLLNRGFAQVARPMVRVP
jgi:glycosyltransferase involved in cell wall biosynthesis